MQNERTLSYNIVATTFRSNAKVEIDPLCNGFSIVNIGTTECRVNGVPLAPPVAPNLLGESVTFGGNRNEVYNGRVDVSFEMGTGIALVQQKIYQVDNQTNVQL